MHPAVEISEPDDGERCIRVRQASSILPGETIVSCPHILAISAASKDHSSSSTNLSSRLDASLLSRSAAFRFRLMYEYALGENSFWWPYFKVLPQPSQKDAFSTPLFFEAKDLRWLDGTNIASATKTRAEMLKTEFQEGLSAVKGVSDDIRNAWT